MHLGRYTVIYLRSICLIGTVFFATSAAEAQQIKTFEIPVPMQDPPAVLIGDGKVDILGVKLGMTQDEVRSTIKLIYPQVKIEKITFGIKPRAADGELSIKFDQWMSLQAQSDDGTYETMKAIFSSPLTGSRLIGFSRELVYEHSASSLGDAKALKNGLEQKFGLPTIEEAARTFYIYYNGMKLPPISKPDWTKIYGKPLQICTMGDQAVENWGQKVLYDRGFAINFFAGCGPFLRYAISPIANMPTLFRQASFGLYNPAYAQKDEELFGDWLTQQINARKPASGAVPRL